MPLVTRGGKLLTVGGKLATNKDCCCCPDVDNLTVIFSGIILDCACVPETPNVGGSSLIVTDISINGTFVIPRVASGQWESDGAVGSYHVKFFFNGSCAGSPDAEFDGVGTVLILCQDAGLIIKYSNLPGAFFLATGSLGASLPNTLSCGHEITFPDQDTAVGHGGTAMITI